MSYLVDSDILIDASLGYRQTDVKLDRLRENGLAVSIISYGEVYEGAIGTHAPEVTLARYRGFLGRFPVLMLDDETMVQFAVVRADLRRRGLLIPDFDLAIAATALQHDLTLLTRNVRHFGRVPGLRLGPV